MDKLYRLWWAAVQIGSAFGIGWYITGDPGTAWAPAFLIYLNGYAVYEIALSAVEDDS